MTRIEELEKELETCKETLSKSHNIDECALLGDKIQQLKREIYFLKSDSIKHEKEIIPSKDVSIVADAKSQKSTTRGQVRLFDSAVTF